MYQDRRRHPEDGGTKFLVNTVTYLPNLMALLKYKELEEN
jgi:hypothetical protein